MSDKKLYGVIVTIDDTNGIVNVTALAAHWPGKRLSFETAWVTGDEQQQVDQRDRPHETTVIHPDDGHEIMTYEDRDEAIGEAMTSLRDGIDNFRRYR